MASTITDLLSQRALDESIGIVADDLEVSWREVVRSSQTMAQHLLSGRSPGPFHVGILMENTPNYLVSLFGSALAGAVAVGINNTRRGDQLAMDIRHMDCQIVLADTKSFLYSRVSTLVGRGLKSLMAINGERKAHRLWVPKTHPSLPPGLSVAAYGWQMMVHDVTGNRWRCVRYSVRSRERRLCQCTCR